MKCNKCGETNSQEARFCRACGEPLIIRDGAVENAPAANAEPAAAEAPAVTALLMDKIKPFLTKKNIIIAAAALVALVLIIALLSSAGTDRFIYSENSIYSLYDPEAEETVVFFNDTRLKDTVDGIAYIEAASENGNVAALISEDGDLYIVKKTSMFKAADDVEYVQICADGSVAVFMDEDNTLKTVKVSNKKVEKIADDCENYAISPDGKTIIYTIEDDDDTIAKIKINNKTTEIEDFEGGIVSNGGKLVIGVDDDYHLNSYNVKKGTSSKISSNADDLFANYDYSEIIFCDDDKYYISINGGEKIKLGNYSDLTPLYPKNSSSLKTFTNALFVCYDDGDYSLVRLNKKHEIEKLVKNLDSKYCSLAEDGTTVYYIRNDNLYVASKANGYEPEKLASDVVNYAYSSDNKQIYYIDDEYTLYSIKNGKENEIAEDVSSSSLSIAENGTAFFLTDYDDGCGTLYRCSNGKTKVRVAEDVYSVFQRHGYTMYYTEVDTDNDYKMDLYSSKNQKTFSKIAEELAFTYRFD